MTLLDTLNTDHGFTFDPRAGRLVAIGAVSGYMIAVPGTERVVGSRQISREAFAAAFAQLVRGYGDLLGAGAYVGGWYSPERGVYLIEVSELHQVSRAEAVALGEARGQETILDIATGEQIPTGGHGDAPPGRDRGHAA